ncbi:hypothetical protein C1I95_30420, partial [Micromonospora craterilacus]
ARTRRVGHGGTLDPRPTLPDWMRDPPPARRTLGTRLADGMAALPGAGWLRRRWWAWQRRQRLYQRFPNTVKIGAMLVSFVVILVMVMLAYGLYGQV